MREPRGRPASPYFGFLRSGRRCGRAGGGGGGTLGGETEVPLADRGGGVAVLFQQSRHREPVGRDERIVIGAVEHALLQVRAPRVAARQQAVARGRADGGAAVRIGEGHALRDQPVEVRRLDFSALGVERLHVAVAQIVGEDVDDVGLGSWGCGEGGRSPQGEDETDEQVE